MKKRAWLLDHIEDLLVGTIVVAAVAAAIPLATYFLHFAGKLSTSNSDWGAFGSFVSGTLGPILNFFALAALVLTLWFQTITFRQTANALEAERHSSAVRDFERAFFGLLTLHSEIVSSIDLRRSAPSGGLEVTAQGRDCFQTFYKRLVGIYKDNRKKYGVDPLKLMEDTINQRSSHVRPVPGDEALVREAYKKFFQATQHEIGHYFRTLYRIMRFIDESPVADKRQYAGIVRAQLSTYEAALLFYNCVAEVGARFKPYVEEYALLDNLDTEVLIDPGNHVALYKATAFGDVPK